MPAIGHRIAQPADRGGGHVGLAGRLSTATTTAAQKANRQAIQAAIRALDATSDLAYPQTELEVPDGIYPIDRPIRVDKGLISIRGQGSDLSTVAAGLGNSSSLFWVGAFPWPTQGVTTDHYPDLFGKLDASVTNAAGQKYGFRSRGTAYACFGSGPFGYPRTGQYAALSALTVDFAYEQFAAGAYPDQPLFGSGLGGQQPTPMALIVTGGQFRVFLGFADGTLTGQFLRWATFAGTTTAGVHRVSIQIDLAAGTVTAWVDGLQVAVTYSTGGSSFGTNLKLANSAQAPFKIGADPGFYALANDADSGFATGTKANWDFACYGLRLCDAKLYTVGAAGSAQARVDNAAITDAKRINGVGEASAFAWLPLDDAPTEAASERWLSAFSENYYRSTGMVHDIAAANAENNAALRVKFAGLSLKAGKHGDAITLGTTTDPWITDCMIEAGGCAVGTWNYNLGYALRIQDAYLKGGVAALYLQGQVAELNTVGIGVGIAGVWLGKGGTVLKATDTFVATVADTCEFFHRGDGGASAEYFEKLAIDIEGAQLPTKAVFYSRTADVGQPTCGRLVVDGLYYGGTHGHKPVVVLESSADADRGEFYLDIKDIRDADYESFVRTSGPAWNGEMRHPTIVGTNPPITVSNSGGRCGIVSHHGRYPGPPLTHTWYPGAHEIDVCAPVNGQARKWRCVKGGTYGTAGPPKWTASDTLDAGDNALAMTVTASGYWSWSGYTVAPAAPIRPPLGGYRQARAAAVVDRILNGTALTAPTAVYAYLSAKWAYRPDVFSELAAGTNPGYARAAVTFAASANGSTSNSASITFTNTSGTVTWPTVLSLGFIDDQNRVIGQVDLAPWNAPLTLAPGASLTFAVGSLTLNRTTSDHRGASDAFWDAMHNFWLRGVAITVPTLSLAMSTAAADVTAAPTEPVGNGYARVAMGSNAWTSDLSKCIAGSYNTAAKTFPAPTGGWGTIQSGYLIDSGNANWFAAPIQVPRSPASGGPAPSFAAGAINVRAV